MEKVNEAIGEDPNSEVSIGVLDIYGFEHFQHNRYSWPPLVPQIRA